MTKQQALIRARGCGKPPNGSQIVAEFSPGAKGGEARWRCKLMHFNGVWHTVIGHGETWGQAADDYERAVRGGPIRLLPEEAETLLPHAPESIRARLVEIANKP
jgi:hypothetical protein